ncbi:MAG: DEAD/DEAH box helicase [Clostridiales bacterium]|nr:DEAD/DEAH box helicase [Clostridiales bacterium]
MKWAAADKTLTSIAIMGALYLAGKIDRVLIVAPTSVVSVWPKELADYADFPFTVQTLLGEKRKRLKAISDLERYRFPKLKVAVINYESVWREGIKESLQEYDPDLIICDESQRIKNHERTCKQSTAMHELGDQARYKMILSGTPIQNNVADIWSQYRFLDRTVFGDLYYPFQNHFCVMHPVFKSKVLQTLHEDELIQKEYSVAFRVTKEEALDLPEQTFETRSIEMTAKERRMYDSLRRESIAELEGEPGTITATTVLVRLLRLQQFTGGFLIRDGEEEAQQISTAKMDALKDIIEDYVVGAGKKLVVFARFIPEVDAILKMAKKILDKEGKKVVSIYGAVKKEERGGIISQFQNDSDTVLIVGQIDTLGVGVTLTAADTCVYYSKTFNYATYEQSLSRIHRIGQRNVCTYIDLVCADSIDEKITRALKKKENLAKTIVDDWRSYF